MSSARGQGYPAIPSYPDAGDHEMRDYYAAPAYTAQPNTVPTYTPYLGLRARLSQVWINRWTILLLLILARVLLAIKDLNSQIANAKTEALSACTKVEDVGSAVASMPHYLSEGVNDLAADGITNAVHGLMSMLMLTVTGVEEIIVFVIHMMTSTYLCLITLAVSGSLHVALEMIQRVGDFMNTAVKSLTEDLGSGINTFQTNLNKFLSVVGDGINFLGGSVKPPTLDLSSQINALDGIQINTTALDADIAKLNASIPSFADVQDFTDKIIRLPFEEVKQAINNSLNVFTFDKTVFQPAAKQTLSFCTDNPSIENFFSGLVKVIATAKVAFLAVLIILAILACVPMAYREIWRWRTMQQRAVLLQKHAFDPMDVIYIASRPYTTTWGIKAASRFKSTKRQILARWFVAYATSLPALFVLALGLAGLFTCLCQIILLRVLEKEVPKLSSEVGDFANAVVHALDTASANWATDANKVINTTNTNINSEVFGWVEKSTTAANNTLVAFTEQMGSALNTAFGGTILYDPIKEVLNCLIGLKIAGIEKGLTWVHDNAHINIPGFKPDIFSLGAAASLTNSTSAQTFLSSPGTVASDDITNAIVKVANKLREGVRQEAIISAVVVGIWFLMMFIGLARALFGMFGRDKTRAEGGPVGYTGDNRVPLSPNTRSPNRSNGARFPTFGAPVSSVSGPSDATDSAWMVGGNGIGDEKVGSVGHRRVEASYQPGHERTSSYGHVAGEKR